MKYGWHVCVHRLDGTSTEARDEQRTREKLLAAIALELQKHENFANSFVVTITLIRAPEVH
jgi:hypothetical protein